VLGRVEKKIIDLPLKSCFMELHPFYRVFETERLITGSPSPFSGGLLAAKAGKARVENKRAVIARGTKRFFIL
jgi:hypothetical protein